MRIDAQPRPPSGLLCFSALLATAIIWLVNKTPEIVVRIISGVAIVAVSIIFGIIGGIWFTLFVFALMLLTAHELWRLCIAATYKSSIAITLLTAVAAFTGVRWPSLPILMPAMSLALLITLGLQLTNAGKRRFSDWAVSFAGGFYIGWTCGLVAALRELENGAWWLLLTLVTVWLADSGAYVFGRLLGKHKLAPAISPSKTWEGYIGGALTALVGGAFVGWASPLGLLSGATVGGLIGLFAVMGDLTESLIKREAKTKDSGSLIPGHGGVFDRVDSLLWAAVITFIAHSVIVVAR